MLQGINLARLLGSSYFVSSNTFGISDELGVLKFQLEEISTNKGLAAYRTILVSSFFIVAISPLSI